MQWERSWFADTYSSDKLRFHHLWSWRPAQLPQMTKNLSNSFPTGFHVCWCHMPQSLPAPFPHRPPPSGDQKLLAEIQFLRLCKYKMLTAWSLPTPTGAREPHMQADLVLQLWEWRHLPWSPWLNPTTGPAPSASTLSYAPACHWPDTSHWLPLLCICLEGECTAIGEHTDNQGPSSCFVQIRPCLLSLAGTNVPTCS